MQRFIPLLGAIDPDDLDEIDSLFLEIDEADREIRLDTTPFRLVAVVSSKGGTGKTSLAINLAGGLQTLGQRTAVLDMDPGRGATKWSTTGEGLPFEIYSFGPNFVASDFRDTLQAIQSEIDILILDTPPAIESCKELVFQVADLVLIPVGASALDLAAAKEATAAAREARHGRTGSLPETLLVPYRQAARTRLARSLERELSDWAVPVCSAVGQRVEVAEAASEGRLVRPDSMAGREFAVLTREIWKRLGALSS